MQSDCTSDSRLVLFSPSGQNFAKTFRPLATGLAKWRPLLRVGGIDCAVEENNPTCTDHNTTGYPTLKIYPGDHREGDSDPDKLLGGRTIPMLRHTIATFLANVERLPLLEPALASALLGKMAGAMAGGWPAADTYVVVEPEGSSLGKQMTLDLLHDEPEAVARLRSVLVPRPADPETNATDAPDVVAAIEQAEDLKVRLGVTTAFAVVLIPAGKSTEPKLLNAIGSDPTYDDFYKAVLHHVSPMRKELHAQEQAAKEARIAAEVAAAEEAKAIEVEVVADEKAKAMLEMTDQIGAADQVLLDLGLI